MKILVADDNRKDLEILVNEIDKSVSDADIDSFDNATDALEAFKNVIYDIVFLDIRMPDIDGISLAEEFNSIRTGINVIYTTTYEEYSYKAFCVHASGYLIKPVTSKQITEELKHLRYGKLITKKSVVARTFGQFDLLVNGKPIHFNRTKSKELIAYLIDRRGGGVTKKELASVIFEDSLYTRNIQDYLGKIIIDLENTLKREGIADIFIKKRNYYAIDKDNIECDLYDYIENKQNAKTKFYGEYMNQYSWSEMTLGNLYFDMDED